MVTTNKKQIDTKVLNNVFYVVTVTAMKSLCTRTILSELRPASFHSCETYYDSKLKQDDVIRISRLEEQILGFSYL